MSGRSGANLTLFVESLPACIFRRCPSCPFHLIANDVISARGRRCSVGAVARFAHGGPVFGASFPGMEVARNWQQLGEQERKSKRGDSLGHWLQTPWRRRDASQLLAKHTLSRRITVRGRLVFLWLPPGRSHWFQHPGNPHKISSPPCSTSRDIPCSPTRVSLSLPFSLFLRVLLFSPAPSFLYGGNTVVLIVDETQLPSIRADRKVVEFYFLAIRSSLLVRYRLLCSKVISRTTTDAPSCWTE